MIGVKINFGGGGGSSNQQVFTFDTFDDFPITGSADAFYIALDTLNTYIWDGGTYVQVNSEVPQEVLNFPNLASFPDPGAVDTIYIADDTGFGYSWNGAQYVSLNNSGIYGSGTANYMPKFISPNTIANGSIYDDPPYPVNIFKRTLISSGRAVAVDMSGNSFLRLYRQQNIWNFDLGNHQIGQVHEMLSTNLLGLSIKSYGDLIFGANNAEVARFLKTNGYFGLNTDTPTERLDVNGNARLRGALLDKNNVPGAAGQVLITTEDGVEWQNRTSSGFIPLTGTEVDEPITGDLQLNLISDEDSFKIYNTIPDFYEEHLKFNWSSIQLYAKDLGTNTFSLLEVGVNQVTVNSDNPTSRGIASDTDFTANITDLDFVQKKYVDEAVLNGMPVSTLSVPTNLDELLDSGIYCLDTSITAEDITYYGGNDLKDLNEGNAINPYYFKIIVSSSKQNTDANTELFLINQTIYNSDYNFICIRSFYKIHYIDIDETYIYNLSKFDILNERKPNISPNSIYLNNSGVEFSVNYPVGDDNFVYQNTNVGNQFLSISETETSLGSASNTIAISDFTKLTGLSTYTDNADAISNGLPVDALYKTADGTLKIVY